METAKSIFKTAWPYQKNALSLPVPDLVTAIPFYQTIMGFSIESKTGSPVKTVILSRDTVRIGLAENGGDPTQDGCFFEVDNVESAFAELRANGLQKEDANYSYQKYGNTTFKVFFVVAPDGLCFCLGERQPNG